MRKRSLLCLALTFTLAGVMMLAGCGSSNETGEDPLKVKCHNGVMVGQEENDVISFLGVPYAKPPTGDLRWRAPEAAEESDEEIICDEFGDTAIQYEWPTEPASYNEKSEDCLTLNIWKGKDAAEGDAKAVMVWFHGGAYSWGGTSDPMYNGQNFVEAHPDVILVTCNYRLGIMAWADFTDIPGGEDYTDLNLGLRDSICALEWIQENIGAFGGDADNVTIFGESAGAVTTGALIVSPAAQGLFSKSIIHSTALDEESLGTIEDAKEFAATMAEYAGCETMDEMLALSGDEWAELDTEYSLGDYSPGAIADGEIVPEDYMSALEEAGDSGITMMIGTNADESYYDPGELGGYDNWVEYLDEIWNEDYEAADSEGKALMDEFEKIQKNDEGRNDVFTKAEYRNEKSWWISAINMAETYSDGGGTAYMYYWDVPSTREDYLYGACHAVELSYIFNNLDIDIYAGDNQDKPTAEKAQQAWVNFAKSGDPSIDEAEWLPYDAENRNTMIISLDGWKLESDPMSNLRKLMTELLDGHGIE